MPEVPTLQSHELGFMLNTAFMPFFFFVIIISSGEPELGIV